MPRWGWWFLAFVMVARVAVAALFPIMPEEAYHWNFGCHPDWSYYDHPPMIAWSIAVGRAVLGDSSLGIRLVPILFSLGTMLLVARLARRFYGPTAAAWSVMLLAVEPAVFAVGSWGFPDAPLLFFWALALTCVWQAVVTRRGSWWLAGGAALGAAMLSKYTAVFLVPSMLIYLLGRRRGRHMLATPWPYLSGVVALLVFMPVIYWNWIHDWVSFRFQSTARFQAADGFSLWTGLRSAGQQWLLILPVTLPLAVAAFAGLVRGQRPRERFLLWSFAPMAAFFLAMGFTPSFHLLWPLPAFLGLTIAMAGAVVRRTDPVSRAYANRPAWLGGMAAIGIVFASLYAARCLPGIPPVRGPYGWEEVAARVRKECRKLRPGTFYVGYGVRPYCCASELAYHLRDPESVCGNNVLGAESLQYRFWSDPAELAGRDAVVVIEGGIQRGMALKMLQPWFDKVEAAGEVILATDSSQPTPRPIVRCSLFRGHGYRPAAPVLEASEECESIGKVAPR